VIRLPGPETVIVHRPYFGRLAPGLSSSEVQQRYRDMRRLIDDYALEMNLPGALIELMFAVPPERGRVLTRDEVSSFMLDGNDPVYDEQLIARFADAWGMSSAEFRRRQSQIEQTCRSPIAGDQWGTQAQWAENNACRLAILASMPLQAARQAIARGFPNWPAAPIPWAWLAALDPARQAPAHDPSSVTRQQPASPSSPPSPGSVSIEETNRRLAGRPGSQQLSCTAQGHDVLLSWNESTREIAWIGESTTYRLEVHEMSPDRIRGIFRQRFFGSPDADRIAVSVSRLTGALRVDFSNPASDGERAHCREIAPRSGLDPAACDDLERVVETWSGSCRPIGRVF
jgi:hypothetical protein